MYQNISENASRRKRRAKKKHGFSPIHAGCVPPPIKKQLLRHILSNLSQILLAFYVKQHYNDTAAGQ